MKKILIIVIVLAIIGGAIALATNNNDNTNPTNPTPSPTSSSNQNTNPTSNNSTTPSPQSSTASKVTIADMSFSPSTLTVKKGTTVTWTNNDSVAHTVVSDSGSELGSENLENGENYTHKFDTVGTFAYHCSIHPNMKATITVTE